MLWRHTRTMYNSVRIGLYTIIPLLAAGPWTDSRLNMAIYQDAMADLHVSSFEKFVQRSHALMLARRIAPHLRNRIPNGVKNG